MVKKINMLMVQEKKTVVALKHTVKTISKFRLEQEPWREKREESRENGIKFPKHEEFLPREETHNRKEIFQEISQ